MWKLRTFNSAEDMQAWIDRNSCRVQWVRVFVNNKPYALEYKRLRVIG